MKTRIVTFVLALSSIVGFAQQDAQFTQYMYNTINVNPAYAGSRGALSIFSLHRTQWVGLNGAPETITVSANTPLNNSKIGIGVSIISDKIGPIQENSLSADVSYTIQTSESYKLSFGLKATANLFDLNVSKLNPVDQSDQALQNFNNKFFPNIGTGLYLHSDKAYVGLSVPNFFESTRYDSNDVRIFREKINYYLIAGYIVELNDSMKFKPAVLTKVVEGTPLQVDISGNLMINNNITLGLAYRWSAAVSAMVGFQISDSMHIGYGYDMETTKLKNYSSGSHEIFLRYEVFKTNKKMITPRFF